MNKKLLFAAMSLVALTACTNDEFQSKQQIAEDASPIQFEVINNAFTRASMNGNKIVWNANDGDLFTLYHGAGLGATAGYENATYKANANEGGTATLSTPSMIKAGSAIMVWPVDSTFRIGAGALTLRIPTVLENIENNIPYVSDLVTITGYTATGAYNTEGLNRSYPVYMRPMASQLTIKTDYAGTDATLASLYTGDDPIEKIKVTSMDLVTTTGGGTTDFTDEIALAFTATAPGDPDQTRWDAAVPNNNWEYITRFGGAVTSVDKLTAKDKCLTGNESCKFLILPQGAIPVATGVDDGGVIVNTIYGKVVVSNAADVDNHNSQYLPTEIADAWYRYVTDPTDPKANIDATNETVPAAPEASGAGAGKYKVTSEPKFGLEQTINAFSGATVSDATSVVFGEPVGAATTRYVKVLLTHLDMSDLHIKNDKQLRDAARVWMKMGLATAQVYLDGDANGDFKISQQTINVINEINADPAIVAAGKSFTVMPCRTVAGEVCDYIVITGGGNIPDLRFIDFNKDNLDLAKVAFNAGETWNWNNVVYADALDVESITNRGDMVNATGATLTQNDGTTQINIPFINDGTWAISGGDVIVQFDVTNNGIVNIAKNAEYHQDLIGGATVTTFVNEAQTLPERFVLNDPSIPAPVKAAFVEQIGKVINKGVFAVTGVGATKGIINNYGLIEHADKDAKTYITNNEIGAAPVFASAFDATVGSENKMGRINLPFSNKDEDNISISAGLAEGFVSVTVSTTDGAPSGGSLNASSVGEKVNYVIINSGVTTVTEMSNKIQFIEFNDDSNKEIAWQAGTKALPKTATYQGLMIFSPVNIKLYTNVVVTRSTYLAAKVYAGGGFTPVNYSGYFGNTASNEASMVITY